jgi:hypothetical protein
VCSEVTGRYTVTDTTVLDLDLDLGSYGEFGWSGVGRFALSAYDATLM